MIIVKALLSDQNPLYYSYVEIEYVPTKKYEFCSRRNDLAVKLLNWARLYQQVIFLLDVMDTSGRAIESKYLDEGPYGEQWSNLIFPKEMPSRSDFRIWK